MKVDYVDLGLRIKKKREKCKLSQADLAAKAQLSTQHISNVENAKSKIGLEKLVIIAEVLGCSLDELVCGSMKTTEVVYRKEVAEMIEDLSPTEVRMLPEFLRCYSYLFKMLKRGAEEDTELL